MEMDDEDFEKKQALHDHKKSTMAPRLKKKFLRVNMPSLLTITCNAIEALRLRHILVDALNQRQILTNIYDQQLACMSKEGLTHFKDTFNLETFLTSE